MLVSQAAFWTLLAIVLGVPMATGAAAVVIWLRQRHRDTETPAVVPAAPPVRTDVGQKHNALSGR